MSTKLAEQFVGSAELAAAISPLPHLTKSMGPAVLFYGTTDRWFPQTNCPRVDRWGYAGSRVCDMLSRIMGISDQERQILDLLSEGCSINEIADKMGISVEAVKFSIDNILEKVASLPPYRKRGYAVS
jgi:DNA-binding CsgD family transcriptional regulator